VDLAILLERCRQGDDLAWEAFVRQFQGRVYALASHYADGTDEARDFAQEVFVHLYEQRRKWVSADQFLPWLIRVTRNTCIDQIRRKRSRPPAFDVVADEMDDLQTGEANPEQHYATSASRRLIHQALAGLAAISREMILLKEIQGLTLQEISAALRIPLGTAKSRSNRARIELARRVLELSGGKRGTTAREGA
jgi:RNA polymerase sigma-70 factor, ECF subfamily